MKKKLLQAGVVALVLGGVAHSYAENTRPNVILVLTDDQGYGDFGFTGNPILKTPNIDKFAESGVSFTNFHVGTTCSPTRAGLMTGRSPNATGVWHTVGGLSLLRKNEYTVANMFEDNGYATGMFGKWHLGDNYPYRPEDRGFQEVVRHGGGGVGQSSDYWNNDYFDDTYFHNGKPQKYPGFCTDVWFNEAKRFISDSKEKPFFCYISLNAPHGPYNAPDKYSAPYRGVKGVPVPNFYGMIANIDENMGQLDSFLAETRLMENTIVIFMTDNGTAGGAWWRYREGKFVVTSGYNAGMRGTKGSEYDGGHRVPFLIRYPKGNIGGGKSVDRLAMHVDLLPTLAALTGVTSKGKLPVHGKSLIPLLNNPKADWAERIMVTDTQRIEFPEKWRKSAVMNDTMRLVNGNELYDISNDPGQNNNIADKYPEIVKQFRSVYEKNWERDAKSYHDLPPIVIGNDKENPLALSCMEWHPEMAHGYPWKQDYVRSASVKKVGATNGQWFLEVAKEGHYRIALRRWPIEAGVAITAGVPRGDVLPKGSTEYKEGRAINYSRARLRIADYDQTTPIAPNAEEVAFRVYLKEGKTYMQSWFMGNEDVATQGAWYVYIEKI